MKKIISTFVLSAIIFVSLITSVSTWTGGYKAWGKSWANIDGKYCRSYLEVWDEKFSYLYVKAKMNDVYAFNTAYNKKNYTLTATRLSGFQYTCYTNYDIER